MADNKIQKYLNRPASVTADAFYALMVGLGFAVVAAVLPLNWVPVVGPQAPGIAGGLMGGLFFYRARSNSPLNFQTSPAQTSTVRRV